MILRSIRVSNWKTLRHLVIDDIPPGITVIHAPNKTGKSNLAEAVKKTLIEWKRGTTKIFSCVTWKSDSVPEVAIEFDAGGRAYRVEKRFSRNKDGFEVLYDITGGGRVKLAEDKEVLDRTRHILGMDKLDGGLAGLLWVEQGDSGVPKIDEALKGSLQPVLGTVMASKADERFRARVENKLKEWYPDSQIRRRLFDTYRKGSIPALLVNAMAEKKAELDGIEESFRQRENDIAESERVAAELSEAKRAIEESDEEVARLKAADALVNEKRTLLIRLDNDIESATRELRTFEEAVAALIDKRKELGDESGELDSLKAQLDILEKTRADAEAGLEKLTTARKAADREIGALDAVRRSIDARANLLDISREMERLEGTLKDAENLEREIDKLTREKGALQAPGKTELKRIKSLLDKRIELDASLKASRLHLRISPEGKFEIEAAIDGDDPERIELTPGVEIARTVGQSLSLRIPGVGRFDVGRGREDENVEKMSAELSRVQSDLESLLTPVGISPGAGHSEIIGELESRAGRAGDLDARLRELREKREASMGDSASIKAEMERLKGLRANIIAAMPDLEGWRPDPDELADSRRDLESKERELRGKLEMARENEEEARKRLDSAQTRYRETKTAVAIIENNIRNIEAAVKEITGKHGSDDEMEGKIGELRKRIDEISMERRENELTDGEKEISKSLEAATRALENRRERYNNIRMQLAQLDERLRGMEGLHPARAATEQALASAEEDFGRLDREMRAYRLLYETYDDIRSRNIGATIGPVADKINSWIGQIEGDTSPRVVFDDEIDLGKVRDPRVEDRLDMDLATSFGEREQIATIARLALGTVLATREPRTVILDDPLTHSDNFRISKFLRVLECAAGENLQILLFTCHPERFDHLAGARFIDLNALLHEPG